MEIQVILKLFTKCGAPVFGFLYFCFFFVWLANLKKAMKMDKSQKYNVYIEKDKLRNTNKLVFLSLSVWIWKDNLDSKYSVLLFPFKSNYTVIIYSLILN